MQRLAFLCVLLVLLAGPVACRKNPEVSVLDPNERVDLSGNWTSADSIEVARVVCSYILEAAWLENFNNAHQGKKPWVKVAPITVRTNGDDISPEFFTNKIIEELINSGKARASHAISESHKAHAELAYQDVNVNSETRRRRFQEQGVHYILTGEIVSQDDANATTKYRAWNTTLKLIDVESGEIVFQKSYLHSKKIER